MSNRKLSGIFFRTKDEDGKYVNRCFEDLAEEEQQRVMKDRDAEWLRGLATQLAKTIKEIGEQFNLERE